VARRQHHVGKAGHPTTFVDAIGGACSFRNRPQPRHHAPILALPIRFLAVIGIETGGEACKAPHNASHAIYLGFHLAAGDFHNGNCCPNHATAASNCSCDGWIYGCEEVADLKLVSFPLFRKEQRKISVHSPWSPVPSRPLPKQYGPVVFSWDSARSPVQPPDSERQ